MSDRVLRPFVVALALLIGAGLVSARLISQSPTLMFVSSSAGAVPWAGSTSGIPTVALGTINSPVLHPDGAVGAPSVSFSSWPTTGFYVGGTNQMNFAAGGVASGYFSASNFTFPTIIYLGTGQDASLQRGGPNTISQLNGNADQLSRRYGANGGYRECSTGSELLVLSTGGATTDTTANLLPANSIIESVVGRVTTTITTATDWKLGDATIAGRFSAANATLVAGTTQVGLVHIDLTGTSGPRQTAAAKVRVTTTGTPGAGAIRIIVFACAFVPPTS